jgi:hypothetical protein
MSSRFRTIVVIVAQAAATLLSLCGWVLLAYIFLGPSSGSNNRGGDGGPNLGPGIAAAVVLGASILTSFIAFIISATFSPFASAELIGSIQKFAADSGVGRWGKLIRISCLICGIIPVLLFLFASIVH